MGRAAAALLSLGAVLSTGGCGGPEGEKRAAFRDADRVLHAYMDALRKGDCERAWGCLSWRLRQAFPLEDLRKDYEAHRDLYRYRAGAKVEGHQYDNFRVFTKLVNGDGKLEFVALTPEDGAWRIEETGANYKDVLEKLNRLGAARHPDEEKGS